MHDRGRHFMSTQRARNPSSAAAACAIHHDSAAEFLTIKQRQQRRRLELFFKQHALVREMRRRGIAHADFDLLRLLQNLVREILHRSRQRGAHQPLRAVFRRAREHPLNLRQEAHVEHAIGFVTDHIEQMR